MQHPFFVSSLRSVVSLNVFSTTLIGNIGVLDYKYSVSVSKDNIIGW